MAEAPIPIIATVREAIEATAEINRGVGREEQRQKWYLNPGFATILLAVLTLCGTADYWAISTYQKAKDQSEVTDHRMATIESKLNIVADMKAPLDQVIRDEMRMEGTVGSLERDTASSREQFGQKLAALDASVTLMISTMQHLSDELHQLNEHHTELLTPPSEFSSEALPLMPTSR